MAALGGNYAEILAVYDEVTGNLVLAEPSTGTVLPVPLTTVAYTSLHLMHHVALGCTVGSGQSYKSSDWEKGDTGDSEDAS